jgi:hypothetical protein
LLQIAPPPPLYRPFKRKGPEKFFTTVQQSHIHSGIFHSTFIIIPVVFSEKFKGTVSQDFSKLYNCFCCQKNKVKKSSLLLILKNFQRSKNITDIYQFTSGLSTTHLFQIQASTEDSKKTYSEDRLFSRLPLPSALPHM